MIPYNTVKPNVPLRKQKKKKNDKSFFSSLIPCLYLSESPVHLLLHLFLSSYYNFTKCTVYEKAKKFRLYLPRSLLSTHLMHGLICNVCYYITCIYCTTKSVHRMFSGSIVLLGREPCGLIRVSNHTF